MAAAKTPQLSVRMEPSKIALLKEIAAVDGKSLNQLVNDELTAVIAHRKDSVLESQRRKVNWLEAAADEFERDQAARREMENDAAQAS